MQIKNLLTGIIVLRITSADPRSVINYFSLKQFYISNITWIDDLTIEVTVPKHAHKIISHIEKKYHCEIQVIKERGLWTYKKIVKHRIVLVTGVVFYLLLSIYIQNHIFFVEVEGNSVTTTREIIECAENNGLIFGAKTKKIRSEQIKNNLLQCIPQLQWVGINTSGCIATISVKQRTNNSAEIEHERTPASIIASRDGTISDITASNGTILCNIGEQVSSGQILISGINNYGNIMLLSRAEGEVYAETKRELTVITIPSTLIRSNLRSTQRQFKIFFGKNIINLYKDSGILDASCVKISKKYNLQLSEGYTLPVGLFYERIESYYLKNDSLINNDQTWLLDHAAEYINTQMIAGKILTSESELYSEAGLCQYYIKYSCREMIGQIKKEEFLDLYGKNS